MNTLEQDTSNEHTMILLAIPNTLSTPEIRHLTNQDSFCVVKLDHVLMKSLCLFVSPVSYQRPEGRGVLHTQEGSGTEETREAKDTE